MKNKQIIMAVAALVLITAILAVLHLRAAPHVEKGCLMIQNGDKLQYIYPSEQAMFSVTGALVNGKGDLIPVDFRGFSLLEVLKQAGIEDFTTVTITAQDEYHAEVNAEEIKSDKKVYLVIDTDGTYRLVVFGDSNSKRNVSNVIKVTIS